jgi:hypothetical protein
LRRPRRCAGGRGGLGGHCRPGWLGCAAAAVEGGLLRLCCAGSCSPRVWIRCAALPAERRSFSRAAPGMRMQALCSTRFCTCRQRLAPRVAPIPPPPSVSPAPAPPPPPTHHHTHTPAHGMPPPPPPPDLLLPPAGHPLPGGPQAALLLPHGALPRTRGQLPGDGALLQARAPCSCGPFCSWAGA